MCKQARNRVLTPQDVKQMSLKEFSERFGFTPKDALEKWGWAMQAKLIDKQTRDMMEAGVLPKPNLQDVVMV